MRYDEYGKPQAGNAGRFQYTGQAWLPEIGLYDYRARVYSPTLGRFLQTDPIGYGDGPNWYNYVRSDPVNKIDPLGLQWPDNLCPTDASGDVVCMGNSGSSGSFGGGGGNGSSPSEVQLKLENRNKRERQKTQSPICQRIQQSVRTNVANADLLGYVTGNNNWNSPATLQGYANLYQSNLDQWQAVNSPIGQWVVGTAISLIPFAKGATLTAKVAGAAAGSAVSVGTSSYIQSEINRNNSNIAAINSRIQQLKSGC